VVDNYLTDYLIFSILQVNDYYKGVVIKNLGELEAESSEDIRKTP